MNVPFFGRLLDERFFEFRRRSTSVAGIAAAELSLLLFLYRYYADHVFQWDLLAVGATFVVVKLGLMTWYYLTK
jgi:hypothetical protein